MADTSKINVVVASTKMKLKAGDTEHITFTLIEVAADFVFSDITLNGGLPSSDFQDSYCARAHHGVFKLDSQI
jgi:hypothetical protein